MLKSQQAQYVAWSPQWEENQSMKLALSIHPESDNWVPCVLRATLSVVKFLPLYKIYGGSFSPIADPDARIVFLSATNSPPTPSTISLGLRSDCQVWSMSKIWACASRFALTTHPLPKSRVHFSPNLQGYNHWAHPSFDTIMSQSVVSFWRVMATARGNRQQLHLWKSSLLRLEVVPNYPTHCDSVNPKPRST